MVPQRSHSSQDSCSPDTWYPLKSRAPRGGRAMKHVPCRCSRAWHLNLVHSVLETPERALKRLTVVCPAVEALIRGSTQEGAGSILEKNTGFLSRERNCKAVIGAMGVPETSTEQPEELRGQDPMSKMVYELNNPGCGVNPRRTDFIPSP